MTMDETYAILIQGEPVPSARPRMVKGHAYLPKRTMTAIKEVKQQASKLPNVPHGTVVTIAITFYCKERRRKDLDNLAKTVLDGLHPHPLIDDNINIVRLLIARCEFVSYSPCTLIVLNYKRISVVQFAVTNGVNMARKAMYDLQTLFNQGDLSND